MCRYVYYNVNQDISPDATEAINELTDDELDFIERELFYAFDEANRAYKQDGIVDNRSAILMYERALETIRAVRTIRDELTEEQLENAKSIHDTFTN